MVFLKSRTERESPIISKNFKDNVNLSLTVLAQILQT
jgi:hypothetical protein